MITAAWARWSAFTLRRAGRAQCTPVGWLLGGALIIALIAWHYRHGIETGLKIAACAAGAGALIFAAAVARAVIADQIAGRREARASAARTAAAREQSAAAMDTAPCPRHGRPGPGPGVTADADGHLAPAPGSPRYELSEHGVTALPEPGRDGVAP